MFYFSKIHEAFNECDHSNSGQLTINEVCEAYYKVTESNLSITDLKLIIKNIHENNSSTKSMEEEQNIDEMRISFDEFCSIIAEFTIASNYCTINNLVNSSSDKLAAADHYQINNRGADNIFNSTNFLTNCRLTLIRAHQLIRIYVAKPLTNILGIFILVINILYALFAFYFLLMPAQSNCPEDLHDLSVRMFNFSSDEFRICGV